MAINDPRGNAPDDDPFGKTSLLPADSSGWRPGQGGPDFAPPPPPGRGDTRLYDFSGFSGSELGPPPPPPRGGGGRGRRFAVGLALVATALGGGVTGAYVATAFGDDAQPRTSAATSPVVSVPASANGTTVTNFAAVARAVQPAVVSITVRTGGGGNGGSGVILDAEGRILTNNHVVEAATQGGEITVTFSDGRSARASIVGTDPLTDLAVIRAEGVSGLTPAALGDSDKLQVGEPVLALGSPLGLDGSVTAGIISALNRTIPVGDDRRFGGGTRSAISGAIQTDAAINPGNSGGALVNASGQVIGINTAIITNGGEGNIGVGFSIPINTAKQVADQLIRTGRATHAFLGVSLTDAMGTQGALVAAVEPGSPAEQAGLRPGDRITKVNDTDVSDADTVTGMIRGFKPGDQVTLSYVRDGETETVTVTLAERTAD
jgi:Trypsin-like serine proteases, typically periplasmic, contain C-terminal PDZ domain